jgi:hypothetical protein
MTAAWLVKSRAYSERARWIAAHSGPFEGLAQGGRARHIGANRQRPAACRASDRRRAI